MGGNLEAALRTFADASAFVQNSEFIQEVARHRALEFCDFTESDLLRESAWVILCSGFRESIVRSVFDYVSLSFCDWESASSIVESSDACRLVAMKRFRNGRKLEAIVRVADHIHETGFDYVKREIIKDPISTLQAFPFIGPVTVWHLAKNLGCDVAKPDRHLDRLSHSLGFRDAHQLCAAVSARTGDAVSTVDLVLWRYIVSCRN